MFLHLRSVVNQLYVKSENELRMTATSPAAGRYEAFYITCPGGLQDGALIDIRAVADNSLLGLDAEGYLGAGRAPKIHLVIQKVGGKGAIGDGDMIALHKPGPGWLPWQKYVRVTENGGLRLVKGGGDRANHFVLLKARELHELTVPTGAAGRAAVTLKDLPAPPGGMPLAIESSHPEIVEVESFVTIPEGQTEATFAFRRRAVPGSSLPSEPLVITARSLAVPDCVCQATVELGATAHA